MQDEKSRIIASIFAAPKLANPTRDGEISAMLSEIGQSMANTEHALDALLRQRSREAGTYGLTEVGVPIQPE